MDVSEGDWSGGIAQTVSGLRRAYASGETRSLDWRLAQLARLADLLHEREPELQDALAADLGRCPLEAWFELGMLDRQLRHARRHLRRWAKPERVANPLLTRPGKGRIVREPLGVVLIIAPWNAPLLLTLGPLIGAIAAGNCAVLKPSEIAPRASAALARLLPEYLDPACFAVVEGAVPETAELLAQRFDHILFTGSQRVARIVLEAAVQHLTPVTLELGGKSPCLVARDADVPTAARRIAWAKFINAGQICIAPDHVLVDARRRDELLESLSRAIGDFYGDDPRTSADFQRIVNRVHFDRVIRYLDDGHIVLGGEHDADSLYVAPTVTVDVPEDAPAMQEEIFGPILPVVAIPDIEAAIERVNARPRPLSLYLFTRDRATRSRVIEGTSSGGVCVNDAFVQLTVPDLPFGGVGASGMGAYQGRWSYETFSHRKAVLDRSSRPDLSVRYPPYDDRKLRWLRRLM
jgi:aldehyde dehydrogenase (NAD+)